MHRGYIKLWRKIDEWEWRDEPYTFSLFCYLLTKANHKKSNYHGHTIQRGQIIFGRKKFSKELKISEQCLRTSLSHLKSTNEVTIKSTSRFSILTLLNYDIYQSGDSVANQQLTSNLTNDQPATNQQLTTSKECKEYKNENNKALCDFELLWSKYPKPIGKKLAYRHYLATVKSDKDYINIKEALNRYKSSKEVSSGFIKNGSTFFNQWNDWVAYTEPKTESERISEAKKRILGA